LACWERPEACGSWAQGKFQEKKHGRYTEWEVEGCRLGPEMRRYLETTLGWPGAQVIGRYRVRQRNLVTGEEQVGERFWLAGAAWELWERWEHQEQPAPTSWVTFWWEVLRGHWAIENRSFHVLDTSWQEDAQRAREVGRALHIFRAWAMNLFRLWGFASIAEGQRTADAFADALLTWLVRGPLPPGLVRT